MDLALQLKERTLGLAEQAVVQQVVAQHADGVLRAGRRARVAADAVGRDARERLSALARVGELKALGGGQSRDVGADDGHGQARDGVGGAAALDGGDDGTLYRAAHRRRAEGGAVEALLAAAHRELGVGREEEVGLGVVLEVVINVAHVGLLVGTEEDTQRIGQLLARSLDLLDEEAGGVQCQDGRALVVDDAAAKQPALALLHLVGVGVPARALGDHVGVGDEGELLLGGASEVGKPEVALAVVGGKTHAVGDAKGLVESLARAGAPGRSLGRVLEVLNRAVAHEGGDVLDHLGPHAVNELVNLSLELGVVLTHPGSPSLRGAAGAPPKLSAHKDSAKGAARTRGRGRRNRELGRMMIDRAAVLAMNPKRLPLHKLG